jgi:probable HAF family extracellular repeat protein
MLALLARGNLSKEPAMSIRLNFSLFLMLVLLIAPAAGQATPRYMIRVVGTPGSTANDLNYNGQVVGQAQSGDASHAFLYTGNRLQDLGTLGGASSTATAINNRGVVVGYADNADGNTRAFVYAIGAMFDLGTLGGPDSYAYGINAAGHIVGGASTSDSFEGILPRAFVYRNGVMRNIVGFPEGDSSVAFGINNSGQVVGRSAISSDDPPEHPYHAFLYNNGSIRDLGTLGGLFSTAYAINEAGIVVGQASTSEMYSGGHFVPHAFVFVDGSMRDLGSLGGVQFGSMAADINNRGQVVGTSDTPEDSRAFLYENGAMFDLNGLVDNADGWFLTGASAINDRQQIAATGCRNGDCYALRLDPANMLPEPGSVLLVATGLALFGALRRMRPRRDLLAGAYTPQ